MQKVTLVVVEAVVVVAAAAEMEDSIRQEPKSTSQIQERRRSDQALGTERTRKNGDDLTED